MDFDGSIGLALGMRTSGMKADSLASCVFYQEFPSWKLKVDRSMVTTGSNAGVRCGVLHSLTLHGCGQCGCAGNAVSILWP
jgi:hypothetical protein